MSQEQKISTCSNQWTNVRKKIIKDIYFLRSIKRSRIVENHSPSIQSFAVKKYDNVKLTTPFLSGKMLMFAKLSLMSFIYQLAKIFYFSDETVKKICEKYLVEKVYIYHVLTDTNSTCLKFIFVSSTDRDLREEKFKDIIFDVIVAAKIYDRFDSSHAYQEQFEAIKENLRRCLGYFEIENIYNPCFVTVAMISKEYYKSFDDISFSKIHKGIKKVLLEQTLRITLIEFCL